MAGAKDSYAKQTGNVNIPSVRNDRYARLFDAIS
jgi:hypothetical protein